MRLDNKVALVTGGTRGIGAAICIRLAREGASIVFTGRDIRAATPVISAIKECGVDAFFHKADVTDKERMEEVVNEVAKQLGSLDILVNNAGITRDSLFIRMKEDDWNAVINTNLNGVFNVTQATAKIMLKQRSGSIINISSVIGVAGNAGQANYAASKAGIIGLTKALAKEFATRHVRVNAIAPGFIETEMTKKLPDEAREKALAQIPLNFFAEPSDIASAAAFLASEDSRYITGQVLVVDGGMKM
ncbi:MAG: 3-oxoacyl-[acyl-carrier-protein] reductase [Candidatus Aquicultor secundus]|uniref:3-oxoacyl-[acyl-carrier-protein] reductase n=1 Tax=Candidatus Aquicultor secundus TaxID=1973895 RepID=A0A2M7T5U3_9ACTN|nr:3-oxoacyl-[acyl-carrier-protein] reductase [Candidatus Aquicultor secundus]NCO65215.1 3-oxoacyl-[acyl-carrier-protein] reductase [Solirubrobacter sp.]OIO83749.1 MAG: 3-oxoacyl-[acyl-carrier-protein] reductase [Candidatus Aquicultor secundus]PIU26522.1 MAG: 3-oxoacyl-[acyl-carrier-protein] reductase [Candidatus Aquicultor secundus]PIW23003.1 MAG: 3-oxoacyl-[acyl-carrier-protein] reductase [Candidatus Aquicultor secundus]PIX51847.1 MAG: 3-oxoacyl-[acyl-carrier-protein] reductase [Candidatus A